MNNGTSSSNVIPFPSTESEKRPAWYYVSRDVTGDGRWYVTIAPISDDAIRTNEYGLAVEIAQARNRQQADLLRAQRRRERVDAIRNVIVAIGYAFAVVLCTVWATWRIG